MNERIKELMIEHNIHVDFKDAEYVFEKFAELIVRECASLVVDDYVILEYFGVE